MHGAKMKYIPAINIFCAVVMLVMMVYQIQTNNIVGAFISALIVVANVVNYFDSRRKNESVR